MIMSKEQVGAREAASKEALTGDVGRCDFTSRV